MKKLMILPAVLLLMAVTPLYANYGEMKKELSAYTPPDFFPARPQGETPAENQSADDEPMFKAVQKELSQVKQRRENAVTDLNGVLTGLGLDQTLVVRMAGISDPPEKVASHIAGQVVLDELRILAALRNPAVLAAQKQLLGELQSYNQVTSLDDMLRQYAAFTRSLNNRAGPLKAKDSVKMAYPLPGLTALKGRIVDSQVGILSEKTAIAVKTAILDTEKAFWDLVFVAESQKVTRETIAAFSRLKDVATILYRSGRTSFQDVLKINIKMEELREELKTLEENKKNIHIRLAELLNLDHDARIGRPKGTGLPPAAPEQENLYALAGEHRQELKVIRFQIQKMEQMVEMGETMVEFPYTVGLSFADNGIINTTGTDAPKAAFPAKTMAGMKNGAPQRAWFGTNKPWLNQTRQNLAGVRQILVKQENAAGRMVRTTWFKLDKARREYALNRVRILPLAKSALDVSTNEYETGSIPFSQAIGSYTYWLKVKLTIAKKKTEAGVYAAELENIIGKKL